MAYNGSARMFGIWFKDIIKEGIQRLG